MAHCLILGLIAEQTAELAIDDVLLGAHEFQSAGFYALGTLGGVSHDEDRLSQLGASSWMPPESVRMRWLPAMKL